MKTVFKHQYHGKVGVIRVKSKLTFYNLVVFAQRDYPHLKFEDVRFATYNDGTYGVEFPINVVKYEVLPDHIFVTNWSETIEGLVNV